MNDQGLEEVVTTHLEAPVLTVSLNRPDVHNAMNPTLISRLTTLFQAIEDDESIRVVILTGCGHSFCAGADLAYMRAAADYDFRQNSADGEAIYNLMLAVDRCPKPVIGRINGSAIGGGVGLVSCCDIAVAVERAKFAFSEVRLGLVPAVIAPFVVNKIGAGQTRQLFLTGERFDAAEAQRIGLVHHVTSEDTLDLVVAERVEMVLLGAPGAQSDAKELIRAVQQPLDNVRRYTAEQIAKRRASEEGKEGMTAFLEKRQPSWQS